MHIKSPSSIYYGVLVVLENNSQNLIFSIYVDITNEY